MKPTRTLAVMALVTSALISGCATYAPQQTTYPSSSQSSSSGYGTVDSIQLTRVTPNSGGAGAVVGGLTIGILDSVVRSWLGGTWGLFSTFFVLALILILKPNGFFGKRVEGR